MIPYLHMQLRTHGLVRDRSVRLHYPEQYMGVNTRVETVADW